MFDLGNGDKEKLEENMEEIKQLVNEGQDGETENSADLEEISKTVTGQNQQDEESNPDTAQNQSVQQDIGEVKEETIDNTNQDNKLGDTELNEESSQDLADPTDENQLDQEFDQMQDDIRNEINSLKQTQEQHQRQTTHENTSNNQDDGQEGQKVQGNVTYDNTGQENPGEVTQTSELVDHEESQEQQQQNSASQPLFLEVDNFEDMKQMIEEMHYLTTEMDDVMQHLVAGVEEDQETMSEAEQIVEEFQARREKVNETLKNN